MRQILVTFNNSYRSNRNNLIVIWLAVALLLPGGVIVAGESAPPARIIHFPKDRSIGRLLIDVGTIANPYDLANSQGYYQWEYFGEAQGDVVVPAGRRLALHVAWAAMSDFSPLAKLGPNDLYLLIITGLPDYPANPDETLMPHLSGLTGLEELKLEVVCIGSKGLRHIKDFKSLKYLLINTDKTVNAGMSHLGGLKSLEILFLGARCTDSGLRHLAKLTSLKQLSLDVTDVSGPGLVHLEKLPSLRSVEIMGMKFTDDGLAYLKNLTFLKELKLYGKSWRPTDVTDAGLAHLSPLTKLENLDIGWIKGITDQGLVHLKPMSSLKKLDLTHSQITDNGLAHLKEIKSLEHLQLPHSSITDRGLAYLSELPKLNYLWVGCSSTSPLTDEGLKHLTNLQSLETLHIGGTGITDVGMSHIAKLTSLKNFSLLAPLVTNEGVSKLITLKSLEKLQLNVGKITILGLNYLNELANITGLTVHSIRQDGSILDIARLSKLEDLALTFAKESAIRDEDLACLEKLKVLRSLQIPSHEAISDAGLAHLADLTSLERLSIGGPNLTDDGLSYLVNMKKLFDLAITGDLTDKGLRHLEGLKGLRWLSIYSANNFSPAALDRLKKKLPNLQIFNVDSNREIRKRGRRPEIGDIAPPFSLGTLDGKKVKLEDYRGKVVLLYFWATWCSPCVASAPGLKEFYEDLSSGHKDFAMISLSMDDDEFKLREFVKQQGLSWPQVRLGNASKVAANYGVTGAPTYFVIGSDGKIVLNREMSWVKIRAAVLRALDDASTK